MNSARSRVALGARLVREHGKEISPARAAAAATAGRRWASTEAPKTSAASSGPRITAAPAPPHKNITLHSLATKVRKGQPISMVTAYDYPSAVHVDKAGIDILLVGDSLGMVELGFDTTLPVTLDDMIHHGKAVARGCRRPLLVIDLPFGTFETSPQQAAQSAIRVMKETNFDAVKVEGGRQRLPNIEAILDCGIACMGHIGLTPQSYSSLGGFKAQGRTAAAAYELIKDAEALQETGCFALVIECVPAAVADQVAKAVDIPVIGIGAGPHTDGQVLVFHDMLGMMQHYHHAEFTPLFCKQYATVGHTIQNGLADYKRDVEERRFPSMEYSPYKISDAELATFMDMVASHNETKQRLASDGQVKSAADDIDNENIKVY
ncbi:3-methyl-2-oxobutanoate hydroxymethyltransferase [Hondaea fermentalgiana]|uniref:3-methyl-2-oxobutanoate hydroxymethyltransferase n=1 Tax=Hondaea fermentalgiana TaxID=2315210 RepID=A0A2R5GBU6_9STRA|nr:3-methyl-2-oxobutanoate hydroxymethyltransferase [Hondaea fermentalgiana]|eukprot:GBG28462.1 3-methyl-2-oxobutanoate hydroxymethyltransferase [Hondaea fermentalgiana]